jgi:hypothetical protein
MTTLIYAKGGIVFFAVFVKRKSGEKNGKFGKAGKGWKPLRNWVSRLPENAGRCLF